MLHNIMAIFTFMGSSILRQDDAYSFQVISKIVDTVIPILVKVCMQNNSEQGGPLQRPIYGKQSMVIIDYTVVNIVVMKSDLMTVSLPIASAYSKQ